MKHPREALSLSGVASQIIALGGYNGRDLVSCEKYFVAVNKWTVLPSLNTPRQWPASVLLKSGKAFCFCGHQGPSKRLNSIESIQPQSDEGKWKSLPLNNSVARGYNLVAVSFWNEITLFGGYLNGIYKMHSFTEEGELQRDLSSDPLIPGYMSRGAFVEQGGRMWAAGQRKLEKEWKWAISEFNENNWSLHWQYKLLSLISILLL